MALPLLPLLLLGGAAVLLTSKSKTSSSSKSNSGGGSSAQPTDPQAQPTNSLPGSPPIPPSDLPLRFVGYDAERNLLVVEILEVSDDADTELRIGKYVSDAIDFVDRFKTGTFVNAVANGPIENILSPYSHAFVLYSQDINARPNNEYFGERVRPTLDLAFDKYGPTAFFYVHERPREYNTAPEHYLLVHSTGDVIYLPGGWSGNIAGWV